MINAEYRDGDGVYLEIVSHDEMFNQLTTPPIIVNELEFYTTEDRERIRSLIYTRYEGDALELLPSCECGLWTGGYRLGRTCPECNTPVLPITERPLESAVWIAPPNGVHALINPEVWTILKKSLTISNFDILEWLVNTNYKTPANEPPVLKKLRQHIPKRSLNYFVEHFDEIVDLLMRFRVFKGRVRDRQDMLEFIRQNRNKIFSKYLPIPSKLGFIAEESPMGTFADHSMKQAIEAVLSIVHLNSRVIPPSQRVLENSAVRVITQLAEYYHNFIANSLSGKPGWFRKHIFGGRPHFTFRAVISSLSAKHEYDELHLPWSLSVMLLRTHLLGKLFQRGYTYIEATQLLNEYGYQYSPLLDELFQELIAEGPGPGIPTLFQRNHKDVSINA